MSLKVGINGTGRIGLNCARVIGTRDDIELVAINSTASIDMLVHLLKYDSVHGRYDAHIVDENTISIGNNKNVKVISNRDITALDFGEATTILECTGKFNSLEASSKHLRNNVKKVVISAPADNAKTFVYGVNHTSYNDENVISNASCTTNCLAPIVKVLHDKFTITNALVSTVHSYTNDQNLLDVKHKDKRRARAAALNMIPTSTGAAKAIGLVMPELSGKLNGIAIRVPTPNVSLVDLSANLKSNVVKNDILDIFEEAKNGAFKGIIEIDKDECVSSDFVGSKFSSIIISDKIICIDNSVKILAWYDNEMGYCHRLIDMCVYVNN